MEPLTREGERAAAGGGAKKAVPGENAVEACARRGPDMDGENGIGGSGVRGRGADEKRGLGLRIRDLPLRSYFLLVVFAVFGGVVLLSGLTIWGCSAFRHYLLPDPAAAYLTMQEVCEDGAVLETTTWMDFGEATRLPRLQTEEYAGTEDAPTGYAVTESAGLAETEGTAGDEPTEGGQPEDSWQEFVEIDAASLSRQYYMMNDHGDVVEAIYSLQKIEKNFDTLTPKRKLAYQICSVAMVAVPASLSVCGILFAGFFFYRKRLERPLAILSQATGQIAAQDLDFSIEYSCGDEMGALCASFERMREELARNNKSMWRLLDQRRLMQASIAHDLRNPIAIIQGYAEYLQMHLPVGDLSPEKTARIASNLKAAAARLEQYTESVRTLNRLEDMEPDKSQVEAEELMEEVRDDLKVMADRAGVVLHMDEKHFMDGKHSIDEEDSADEKHFMNEKHSLEENRSMDRQHSVEKPATEDYLMIDKTMFFRILENVFENAARFARSEVSVDFERKGSRLTVTVADDGAGFPEEILRKRGKAVLPTRQEDGHLGMGLAISRVLCEKHGGSLRLGNRASQSPGEVTQGAMVNIFLAV